MCAYMLSRFSCVQSLWHYRLQPTRLLCPWDSPGSNTGAGCHALLQGNLPDPGIELVSLMSPALAVRLFTISTTWKALSLNTAVITDSQHDESLAVSLWSLKWYLPAFSPKLLILFSPLHAWFFRIRSLISTQFRIPSLSHNAALQPCLCEIECMSANVTMWSMYAWRSPQRDHMGLFWPPSSKDSKLPMHGVWVWSLVGELRSHMPHGKKKKKRELIRSLRVITPVKQNKTKHNRNPWTWI